MLTLAIGLLLLGAAQPAVQGVPAQPIQSPTALSASERAAIKNAIGKSRIVLLGELTHGDGTAFQLKTELVKFLHQDLGFDVLIWESGLYDCAEMDAMIGSDQPLSSVAPMGVFGHWSRGAESFGVFEYARQVRSSGRPLTFAGFDIQASGSASNSQFPDILAWFEGAPELGNEDREAVGASFALARGASQAPDPRAAMAEAQIAVYATASRFLRAIDRHPKVFRKRWGPAFEFRRQVLVSAREYGLMLAENARVAKGFARFQDAYNLRERANAANLVWLVNRHYRGKKVIVWAHNVHIFRGLPGRGAGTRLKPAAGDVDSMGRIAAPSLGKESYSIGFVASSGSWSWMGNPEITYQLPADNSLEAALGQAGHDLAFVDLRSLPKAHSLRSPKPAIIDQQNPFVVNAVWPDGFDALIYVRKMRPRTQLQPSGS